MEKQQPEMARDDRIEAEKHLAVLIRSFRWRFIPDGCFLRPRWLFGGFTHSLPA